jgi:hypothetical protein
MKSVRQTSMMLLPLLVLTVHTAGANGPKWTMPYDSTYYDIVLGRDVNSADIGGVTFTIRNNLDGAIAAALAGQGIGLVASGNVGVYSGGDTGVWGIGDSAGVNGMGDIVGVQGFTLKPDGVAVYGDVSKGGGGTAVAGVAFPYGTAVYGASDSGPAVYGFSISGNAGEFHGNMSVVGTLSKGGGGFKIDHPLDPANKFLSHSFVESPDMKTVYDGVAVLDGSGQAVVDLPAWFEPLNRDFRYQLTAIGAPAPDLHIAAEIANNRFRIAGGPVRGRVSWQVTGIRRDAYAEHHRVPVEEEKSAAERGKYLYPVENGQPERLGIYFGDIQKAETLRIQASKNNEALQRQLQQYEDLQRR